MESARTAAIDSFFDGSCPPPPPLHRPLLTYCSTRQPAPKAVRSDIGRLHLRPTHPHHPHRPQPPPVGGRLVGATEISWRPLAVAAQFLANQVPHTAYSTPPPRHLAPTRAPVRRADPTSRGRTVRCHGILWESHPAPRYDTPTCSQGQESKSGQGLRKGGAVSPDGI